METIGQIVFLFRYEIDTKYEIDTNSIRNTKSIRYRYEFDTRKRIRHEINCERHELFSKKGFIQIYCSKNQTNRNKQVLDFWIGPEPRDANAREARVRFLK